MAAPVAVVAAMPADKMIIPDLQVALSEQNDRIQSETAKLNLADREITIKPGTKWVNVNNGETVAFSVSGKTFTWHFDTLPAEDQFRLQTIAPEGVDVGAVTVYVASNPLYRG